MKVRHRAKQVQSEVVKQDIGREAALFTQVHCAAALGHVSQAPRACLELACPSHPRHSPPSIECKPSLALWGLMIIWEDTNAEAKAAPEDSWEARALCQWLLLAGKVNVKGIYSQTLCKALDTSFSGVEPGRSLPRKDFNGFLSSLAVVKFVATP